MVLKVNYYQDRKHAKKNAIVINDSVLLFLI